MKFKPTPEECRIIRACGEQTGGIRNAVLRPGSRYNMESDAPKPHTFNIALISEMPFPKWDDTDLADNCTTFAEWRAGDILDEQGRGIFDFYVYRRMGRPGRDYDEELMSNVTAYYEDGKLSWVEGTCDGKMWTKEGGFA